MSSAKITLTLTFFLFAIAMAYASPNTITTNLAGVGVLSLVPINTEGMEGAQLVLQKNNETIKHVIDSYEGLIPWQILRQDLNSDGSTDIIVVLAHADETTLQPYIYTNAKTIARVFPEKDAEINPIFCNEVFVTASKTGLPLLGVKNKINFHDFGPPYLNRTDLYALQKGQLNLTEQALSKGDHFNILMNLGALALQEGRYQEAIKHYNSAITSSTGDLTTKAFLETIFYLAEANKFANNYTKACELYEKLVLEFSENNFTEMAQKEIEFINANLDNLPALSYYLDIISDMNCNKWEQALEKANSNKVIRDNNPIRDRLLLAKAEIYTALNKVDEAIKVYNEIKNKFPNSPIIDNVNELLEDITLQIDTGLGL
jgi:tetratricopeptide (TPR) repeat protein